MPAKKTLKVGAEVTFTYRHDDKAEKVTGTIAEGPMMHLADLYWAVDLGDDRPWIPETDLT